MTVHQFPHNAPSTDDRLPNISWTSSGRLRFRTFRRFGLKPLDSRLIDLMQSPDIHGVVTREFSRLMRPENFADYALLQAFVDSKTVLYLPDGPIDLASKSGRCWNSTRCNGGNRKDRVTREDLDSKGRKTSPRRTGAKRNSSAVGRGI